MYVSVNYETYLHFHVKHRIFLSDIVQIRSSSTDFHRIPPPPQYQISKQFARCDSRWYMQTIWQTKGHTDMLKLVCAFRDYANVPKN